MLCHKNFSFYFIILPFFFSGFIAQKDLLANDKQNRMERLRRVDHIYQVYLARSATRVELKKWHEQEKEKIYNHLAAQKEFKSVFQCRIHNFINGGQSYIREDCALGENLDPKKSLDDTLSKFFNKEHERKNMCQSKDHSLCFSSFLAKRMLASFSDKWLEENTPKLKNITYHELLKLFIN